MSTVRILGRRDDGTPILTYVAVPGVPLVTTVRLDRQATAELENGHAHDHEFPVFAYFEHGGGSLRLGNHVWPVEAGDVYLAAPGEVVGTDDASGLKGATGWGVFFSPEILGPQVPGAFLSWRSHPLLFPFVQGTAGGAQRLQVPLAERRRWSDHLAALDLELRRRQEGYQEAALALLTLLLVDIGRLAVDIAGDLKLKDEPLLAEVFGFIDEHYGERISLKDVAWAVSLSPGHLTTVVRRKTGRTVQEWIAERRMAQARRLLVETNLAVEEVGQQVGYGDSGYFVRSFRRAHGTTPLGWRHAGRP